MARRVMVEGTCRRRQIGGCDPARVALIVWTVRAGAVEARGLVRLVLAMAVILPYERAAWLTVVMMISSGVPPAGARAHCGSRWRGMIPGGRVWSGAGERLSSQVVGAAGAGLGAPPPGGPRQHDGGLVG